jgi:spore germination cell wall hydrolase CwlJ-like protein
LYDLWTNDWNIAMVEAFLVCIATAVYFEARSEPLLGQIAVAQVIMNRVESSDFPNDPCSVVTQSKTYSWNPELPIKHKCQFSFYCDGKSDTPKNDEAFEIARMVAWGVYHDNIYDPTDGSTFYHADYVDPFWAKQKKFYRQISTHIFYK